MGRCSSPPLAAVYRRRASAHHSFAATYDREQEGDDRGRRSCSSSGGTRIRSSTSSSKDGGKRGEEQQRWAAEWGSGGQLGNQGVASDTLKVGDHLMITGDPSRTPGDYRVRVRTIYRPKDEWRWGGEFD